MTFQCKESGKPLSRRRDRLPRGFPAPIDGALPRVSAGGVRAFFTRVVVCAVLAAAGSSNVRAEVSFAQDLMPTIKSRCGACHITGDEPGKMALVPGKAYDSLVAKPSVEVPSLLRVKAGDLSASYLWHKVKGTHLSVGGQGVRMPMHQPPLPAAFLNKLERWIEAGAPNN